MERIKEIWNQLEAGISTVPGLFKLRYSNSSKCDAYLGLKLPENCRMLILRAPLSAGKHFTFRYEFKGLRFEKVYDPDDANFLLLNLVVVNKEFDDVFDSLLVDVLDHIIDETDLKIILRNYTSRLVKWQSLFERFSQQGLSADEQRGLFGEVFFLRKFLQNNSGYLRVIDSWVGPEKQIRDFQFATWSIEVKTSHGNNHQRVHISSERQLDASNVDDLFLYHLSLEARQQSGETLNEMVASISGILHSDFNALSRFQNKLLEGGYFVQHKHLYEDTGYIIRQATFYRVCNDFPRIEEKDVRRGVGDVKYSVIISQCSDYIRTEQQVFQTLRFP